jgi:rifampicin phosphotransferase
MTLIAAVTFRLSDPVATDPKRAGGKGANLAVLTRAGLPVPVGFVVATAAYRAFVRRHQLDVLIQRQMAYLDSKPDSLEMVSELLRQAFAAAEMSAVLRTEITAAYAASTTATS